MSGDTPFPKSNFLSLTFWCAIALTSVGNLPSQAAAQRMVPVSNRSNPGWGNGVSALPRAIDPRQEENQLQQLNQTDGDLRGFAEGNASQTNVIIQRYSDGKPQVTRQVMQDDKGNFLNHGQWQLLSRRGDIMAEGEFNRGLMDGAWQRWHPANSPGLFTEAPFSQFQGPFISNATFKSGKLDGSWNISDRHHRKILELAYKEGIRDGRATWFYPNGLPMREVDFRDGQLHGQMTEYDQQNKKTREATFQKGQELLNRKTFYFKDQQKSETNFLGPESKYITEDDWWNAAPAQFETIGEEVQHGPTREWYPNGQLRLSGTYRAGTQSGSFMWWHSNGQKQIEGSYIEGRRTGIWTWYHRNGQPAIEGSYQNNSEVGIWRWWNENGQVEDEQDFKLLDIQDMEDIEGEQSDGDQESDKDPDT